MPNHLTSAYGGDVITVDAIVKDPTWIQERVYENLDGAFLEAALFRNGGSNDGIVAYREAAAPFLNDDAEEVAEFGEIPVSDLNRGKVHKLIGIKTALGIRISREMRRFNKIDQVNQQMQALQNTMVDSGVRAALAAFKAAEVQELAVNVAWEDADATPMRDIRNAKRLVGTAKDPLSADTARERLMGYKADLIVLNEATLDVALFAEETQRFYNGNAAIENPIYKGITPGVLGGLRVVTSQYIPEGEAYVMQSGVAGFISDADPLTVTPLYSPSGENGFGGANQSWRADAFRNRIIAVDNPLAVVKLTGIED